MSGSETAGNHEFLGITTVAGISLLPYDFTILQQQYDMLLENHAGTFPDEEEAQMETTGLDYPIKKIDYLICKTEQAKRLRWLNTKGAVSPLQRMNSDVEMYAKYEVLLDRLEQQACNIDFDFLNLKI